MQEIRGAGRGGSKAMDRVDGHTASIEERGYVGDGFTIYLGD